MNTRFEQLRSARRAKLEALRARGVEPYGAPFPNRNPSARIHAAFARHTAEELEAAAIPVRVAGRVISLRPQGRAGFAHIQDASGRMQLFVQLPALDETSRAVWEHLDLGDILGADGIVMRTRTGELTVRAQRLVLLTKALRPLPDKHSGLQDREERYRQRHLDLLANPESRAVFEARSRIIRALRRTLDADGFLEVETPVLVPLAGGAAARPFLTYHNALQRQLSLRIATELHLKRLVVGGMERVYEIGRVFRNEGLSTRHNPEFTSLEAYQAYAGYREMMDLTERLVREAGQAGCGTLQVGELDLSRPFRRITMIEAVREATGLDFAALPTDGDAAAEAVRAAGLHAEGETWGELLADLFERYAQERLQQPTFVVGYPVEVSPLAKRDPADPRLTERFELFINGWEVANAFSELNDPLEQRTRFEAQLRARRQGGAPPAGETAPPHDAPSTGAAARSDRTQATGADEPPEGAHPLDEEFLAALEVGLPPTGGLGIGVDRLVMILTGARAIRDVILFPILREDQES